ncbi:unnamed protein product [Spirodela intermedia]|uniref:RRM domain-containing protein n=2 Tax=Spirodela intermedia TaxID=51605 RepID=A0A7I8LGI5_SPIIN|nr:unnamed protein product [Spirodela intermedia]CAA6671665.1 unnamed protein product [Spirodela intermedia]CAA7408776.1 unnamed protein product [Spirodela intermedia]
MEAAAEERNDVTGAEEYEYEEIVEEVEEEVEEEIEEEVEEEEGDGDGGSQERGVDKVDSGGQEMKQSVSGTSSEGKIFVGGLAWETTEDTFSKHFRNYGEITDSVIMKEKGTGRPRGFGFITFADPSVVEKVLEDDHVIDGRTVEVKRTVPRESMQTRGGSKTKKIFVGGLPTSLTEEEFKDYFSSYGAVVEHQIMLDHKTGRSRGFGFITFESEDSVDEVMSQGKMHSLGGKQVEIKKAEPKKGGEDGRGGYGPGGGSAYGGGYGGGGYGYGGGHRSGGGGGYGGRISAPVGGYGRGYGGGYGGGYEFGMGYGGGYGGPMYGATGYGGGYGYGGSYGGGGGGYGGGGGGRYGRYHPYGR